MVTLIQDDSLARGISGAGSAIANAIAQRRQRQRQAQQFGALGEVLQGIDSTQPVEKQIGFLAQELGSRGINPEIAAPLLNTILSSGLATRQQEGKLAAANQQKRDFLESVGLGQVFNQPNSPSMAVQQASPRIQEPSAASSQEFSPIVREGQPKTSFPLANLTDYQLQALVASGYKEYGDLAKLEIERRSSGDKNFRADREYAYKRAKPFLEQIDKDRKRVVDQEEALFLMEDAIQSGATGFFTKDNFANFLGQYGENLRTAKGAQLLTAQKDFLVSDIGRVGNRPNQWIEQQISTALTNLGRSQEANQVVVDALKARIQRDRKRIELTDQISSEYQKEHGYEPADIGRRVDEAMKPYNEEVQKELAYSIRQAYEEENKGNLKSLLNQKVPEGTPLTVNMAALFLEKYKDADQARKNAKKLGYVILDAEDYKRFEQ